MRTNSSSALIFLLFGLDDASAAAADLRWASNSCNGLQAGLNFVVDVFGDERHFLDHLLLVEKFGEGALQFLSAF